MCIRDPLAPLSAANEEGFEFRSEQDDAWYEAKLDVLGQTLVVYFVNYSDESNEYFRAGDFRSIDGIEAFGKRFRPASIQYRDHECPLITKDTDVCAACDFENSDLKYFDATVVKVNNKKHALDRNGEEQCDCSFEIFWRHGPHGGTTTLTTISHLCKLPPYKLDPTMDHFMKLSRECLQVNAHEIPLPPKDTIVHGEPSSSKDVVAHGHLFSSNQKKVQNIVSPPRRTAVCNTTSSKGTLTNNRPSSSRGVPSSNIVGRNHGPSRQRDATPNLGLSLKENPISHPSSSSQRIPIPSLSSSSRGIPVSHPSSSSKGTPIPSSGTPKPVHGSSRGITIPNPGSLSERNANRFAGSLFKGSATHKPCSSSKGIGKRNPCAPLKGPAICNPSRSLTASASRNSSPYSVEPATHNPIPSSQTAVHRRVSFTQEVEVINNVQSFSGRNVVAHRSSEGNALCSSDPGLRGTTVPNSNPFSKRDQFSKQSSFKDNAEDCNSYPSPNEVLACHTDKSRRLEVHNTNKEHSARGHECNLKINVQEWFMEQRRKRRGRCATRTDQGRQNGLCKKNRRGKLEIRLG